MNGMTVSWKLEGRQSWLSRKPGNYCVLLATLVLTFILEGWYGWFFGGKDTNSTHLTGLSPRGFSDNYALCN